MTKDTDIEQLAIERDIAFTEAVLHNYWYPFFEYCYKYGIAMPDDEKVCMAGVYKAVQDCTNIPDDVKKLAAEKCARLGFKLFAYE